MGSLHWPVAGRRLERGVKDHGSRRATPRRPRQPRSRAHIGQLYPPPQWNPPRNSPVLRQMRWPRATARSLARPAVNRPGPPYFSAETDWQDIWPVRILWSPWQRFTAKGRPEKSLSSYHSLAGRPVVNRPHPDKRCIELASNTTTPRLTRRSTSRYHELRRFLQRASPSPTDPAFSFRGRSYRASQEWKHVEKRRQKLRNPVWLTRPSDS